MEALDRYSADQTAQRSVCPSLFPFQFTSHTMRVATCTPVTFEADAQFFGRDSGLLCRGFQAAGVDCVMVMPGVRKDDDSPDLIRCRSEELASTKWWSSLGLDLVVLYAWGDPVYRPVADAIRKAGIPLIQSLDTAGLNTPYGDTRSWLRCLAVLLTAPQPLFTRLRLLAKALRDIIPALYENKRLDMMDSCDRLAVVSPAASRSVAAYVTALGQAQIASKILVAPHPVVPVMQPAASTKPSKLLVVGRWRTGDRAQKDPELTLAVLDAFLHEKPDWTAEVVGRGSEALKILTRGWSEGARSRLTLTESVPREELVRRYQESRILLCCSRFESFHISSAEALCCGCTVVVADHPLLASTAWFTTRDSGTLARNRTVSALTTALHDEATAWELGGRDAAQIATAWSASLHAHQVASNILKEFGTKAVISKSL
jgi:glycosyltransferase involved in cell wall biosynthesis